MNTQTVTQPGLFGTTAGQQAIATIAELARLRQQGHGREGARDPLLSWESVTEFGEFKITVRCEYDFHRA
jgi:hypothetical protein